MESGWESALMFDIVIVRFVKERIWLRETRIARKWLLLKFPTVAYGLMHLNLHYLSLT